MFELAVALNGIKATFELFKAAIDARDEIKISAAKQEMETQIFDLSISNLAVVERLTEFQRVNGELEAQVIKLAGKLEERARYSLFEIVQGKFVYKSPPPTADVPTPTHYLCQLCWDSDVKSVLQLSEDKTVYHCKRENTHFIRIAPAPRLTMPR